MILKKLIKKSMVLLLALLFTTSCDNWLNLEPENSLIVQEFWQKKSDVDAVMAAMYSTFRETSKASLIWGEARADIMQPSSSRLGDYYSIAYNTITPSNGAIKWDGYYKAINMANTILQYAGQVVPKDDVFSQSEKLSYDAEAIFIKSLSYFYLVRLWKAVPYIASATSSDTVNLFVSNYELVEEAEGGLYSGEAQARAILEIVIDDLKRAEEIAYTTQHINEPEYFYGRANKYSIQALLADIYLWLEDYESCLEYCNKFLESPHHRLLNQTEWFQLYFPGNSRESIFEIQFNANYAGERNPMYNDVTPIAGAQGMLTDPEIYPSLYGESDIRSLSKGPQHKYTGTSPEPTGKRTDTEESANIIYYRYADILLMKAEALAELAGSGAQGGSFTDARILINEIRARAGAPVTDIIENIESFREAILLERAREFAFEGKRWFDLLREARRNNYENTINMRNILIQRATTENIAQLKSRVRNPWYYYLPIPDGDINSNHNLEQNPFYDDDSKIY